MDSSGSGGLRLAIIGATGAVGGRLVELIDERALACAELRLYSSDNHLGESIETGGVTRRVELLADPAELSGLDLVFLAVQRADAEPLLSAISGPVVVDLSAASLPPSRVPFIAPGFGTREQVRELSRFKLFHLPHPVALALATIFNAIGEVPFCAASVMMGASCRGHHAISHLVEQSADLLNGKLEIEDDEDQVAFNAGVFPGAAELEKTLLAQTTTLIGRTPQLNLQCIEVPMLHGTAISANLPNAPGAENWAAALREAPGILVVENEEPATVVDAIEQEALLLSLRRGGGGTSIWCVFDNARRAALAALWIAECLVRDPALQLN
jgi:aspartate-semialdehyde dehydrogenase